jgi:hypothetical protein
MVLISVIDWNRIAEELKGWAELGEMIYSEKAT